MACACSAILFTNLRGDIILEKRYRDDIEREVADLFRTVILAAKDREASLETPVQTLGSHSFLYMRHSDIYILCLTRNNANSMLAFQFMSSLVRLLQSYFETDLCESSIKANFVLIYELLDEAMDYGFPQLTDLAALKSLIFQKGFKLERLIMSESAKKAKEAAQANATLAVTGAVGWRREGIKYKKNEIFLDIVEQVNLLANASGTVLRCDVLGRLLFRCQLSDMPELRLGLNDVTQDATFHQCVNLATYEASRSITFVPPDGEFELMRYRCSENINLPFKVLPTVVEQGRTKIEVNINIKSLSVSKLEATGLRLLMPVPENTAFAKIVVTAGKAKYDGIKHQLIWKVPKFAGGEEHTMRAEVTLLATTTTGTTKPWTRPPLQLQFQVPMYSASSLRVSYLKILERKLGTNYKVDKWVRKICRSGDYLIKTS